MDPVKHKLRAIVASYIRPGLDPSVISDEADLREFGVDSVNALELFAEIESQFGICFDGSEIDFGCENSIESIARLVSRRLAA